MAITETGGHPNEDEAAQIEYEQAPRPLVPLAVEKDERPYENQGK